MEGTLVDSNVLLDVLTEDPHWFSWSSAALDRCVTEGSLCINPVIYAEVSIGFQRIEEVEAALPPRLFHRLPISAEAAFLAGKAFVRYRRLGGARTTALPDFFVGAQAAVAGLRLLTRDARRFRSYFPKLEIIAP